MEKRFSDYSIDEMIECSRQGQFMEKKAQRVPELILKSQEFMYPEKVDQWGEYLWDVGPVEFYCAEKAFKIILQLQEGASMDDVVAFYNQLPKRDGTPVYMAYLVCNFADRGPDFFERLSVPVKDKDLYLQTIREKNKRLAEKYQKKDTRHSI